MEHLYEQTIALLGKSVDSDDFLHFCTELNEEPQLIKTARIIDYIFKKHGVGLWYVIGSSSIVHVSLHLATAGVESGWITSFPGKLPANITRSDSPEIVTNKLGFNPDDVEHFPGRTKQSPDDLVLHFSMLPYRLRFSFRAPDFTLMSLSVNDTRMGDVDDLITGRNPT
jgi:hypothetical protein